MASFFDFIECVTTEAGNIPGNFSANLSVFSSSLDFSTTLGSTITFSPAKSFPSINDIPSTGNEQNRTDRTEQNRTDIYWTK